MWYRNPTVTQVLKTVFFVSVTSRSRERRKIYSRNRLWPTRVYFWLNFEDTHGRPVSDLMSFFRPPVRPFFHFQLCSDHVAGHVTGHVSCGRSCFRQRGLLCSVFDSISGNMAVSYPMFDPVSGNMIFSVFCVQSKFRKHDRRMSVHSLN